VGASGVRARISGGMVEWLWHGSWSSKDDMACFRDFSLDFRVDIHAMRALIHRSLLDTMAITCSTSLVLALATFISPSTLLHNMMELTVLNSCFIDHEVSCTTSSFHSFLLLMFFHAELDSSNLIMPLHFLPDFLMPCDPVFSGPLPPAFFASSSLAFLSVRQVLAHRAL